MADSISNLSSTTSSSSSSTTTTAKKTLDQESFFKLMTMQLSYQDPFKPVENSEMLSQMTSMSTAEGISNLTSQMTNLNTVMTSSQALQASALVGQDVLIGSNKGYLESGGSMNGTLIMGDGASNVTVTVEDANGQVIRQVKLDGTQKGNVAFTWDGKDNSGNAVKEGNYQLKVSGTVNGKNETFNGLVYNRVESVTLGTSSNPTTVKLKGIGAVYLTDILEIAGSKSNTSSGTGSST